jgi:hypothetical protein
MKSRTLILQSTSDMTDFNKRVTIDRVTTCGSYYCSRGNVITEFNKPFWWLKITFGMKEVVEGNETADQLARRGSLHPFIGPEPACGISERVSRRATRDWMCREHQQ